MKTTITNTIKRMLAISNNFVDFFMAMSASSSILTSSNLNGIWGGIVALAHLLEKVPNRNHSKLYNALIIVSDILLCYIPATLALYMVAFFTGSALVSITVFAIAVVCTCLVVWKYVAPKLATACIQ